uniref:Uncharacterized protein n=1 Tax=Moschus moschiferus TaxID=68415 RepID=A0A8C6MLU0_MOSMO
HELSKCFIYTYKNILKSTFILVITFYILILHSCILNIQCENHVIICSALYMLCITYLSLKMFFQEMNTNLNVLDCIFTIFYV